MEGVPRRPGHLGGLILTGVFDTWRSLCVDQNLSNLAAVDLMAALVSSAGAEASTAHLAE